LAEAEGQERLDRTEEHEDHEGEEAEVAKHTEQQVHAARVADECYGSMTRNRLAGGEP
jgi:hypothetical protein